MLLLAVFVGVAQCTQAAAGPQPKSNQTKLMKKMPVPKDMNKKTIATEEPPKITVIGANPLMTDVQHETKGWYIDAGALCSDQIDGPINENIVVSGDIVNLARPGEYKLEYHCKNYAGLKAVVQVRTVVVTEFYDPGCANVTVSGRSEGLHHSSRMGSYLLEYTRCEGDVSRQGVDTSPDARCIQTNDGRPIYRQSDGPNFLYFHKDKESKKGGVWVIDMTDEYEEDHLGIQVESSAGKPEDISGAWQMASKDGRWVAAPKITVSCGAPVQQEETSGDYEVDAKITLLGLTLKQFTKKNQHDFIVAVADALDVPIQEVVIAQAVTTKQSRRLLSSIAATNSIDVHVVITDSSEVLNKEVIPQLQETMFEKVLTSELQAQGIPITGTQIDRKTMGVYKTTKAKLRDTLYATLVIAVIGGMGVAGLVVMRMSEERRTDINFDDSLSEERQSLKSDSAVQTATDLNEDL